MQEFRLAASTQSNIKAISGDCLARILLFICRIIQLEGLGQSILRPSPSTQALPWAHTRANIPHPPHHAATAPPSPFSCLSILNRHARLGCRHQKLFLPIISSNAISTEGYSDTISTESGSMVFLCKNIILTLFLCKEFKCCSDEVKY